ncbi:hypothetical protein [Acinetobacter sp.]|uniref:hypothetical protein n=1 Tax=Acinetobacter sp. TaxID=472 RepID=UPI00388DD13B
MINLLALDTRNLLKAAFEISYFSRGAWSYDSVLLMSPLERDLAVEFINKRLEAASKSPSPVY